MRKAAAYEAPLPSKEPLLLVNGLRSFMARPVYSTDEHGADKHKMERYLHEGRWAGWKERKKERRKGKREDREAVAQRAVLLCTGVPQAYRTSLLMLRHNLCLPLPPLLLASPVSPLCTPPSPTPRCPCWPSS